MHRLVPAAAVLALTMAGAAEAQGCAATAPRGAHSIQHWARHDDGDKRLTIRWRIDDCELRVDSDGDFTVRPDLSGFVSVSRNGYVEIEERDGRDRRSVRVAAGSDGLEYEWSLNGANRFDVDRERWLANVLVALERRTGMFAQSRVPQLIRQGGAEAVLDEARLLHTDHARRAYYSALLAAVRLDDAQLERLLTDAGASLSSDYERGELLRAVARAGVMSDRVLRPAIRMAHTMSSDYEKRRALSSALESVATPAARQALFAAAASMKSNYELAELLIAAQRRSLVDSASAAAYFGAVTRIKSDYERRRTLSALLRQRPQTDQVLLGILDASAGIASDHELATLLVEFARGFPVRGALREQYLKATRTIASDHEYRRALQALLDQDRQT